MGSLRPPADFEAAGLFLARRVLDPIDCRRLREEADGSTMVKATVSKVDQGAVLEEGTRRTMRAAIPAGAQRLVDTRLAELLPDLESHFGEPLVAQSGTQILVYRRGDFFRAHCDTAEDPSLPSEIRRRRVSMVLFLNSQSRLPEDGAFCGGALNFFRVLPVSDPDHARAELRAEEGLVVAFRADVTHEVRPVTHGARYTAVSWLLSPDAPS